MSHPLYFAEDGDEIGESFTDGIPPSHCREFICGFDDD